MNSTRTTQIRPRLAAARHVLASGVMRLPDLGDTRSLVMFTLLATALAVGGLVAPLP